MNIDLISIIIFIIIISIILYVNRKKVFLQKIIYPFLYVILYKTKVGLKLMESGAKRYGDLIKFFGYISTGLGFIGMVYISYSILSIIIKFLISPKTVETGFTLVLPGTNIPGIGFLSFWHWLIAIFILAVVHEFSHGIVSEAWKIKVKSSGFAFFAVLIPIIPAAFVEPNEKLVKKQPDIVQYSIFSAGPISNIALALVFLLIMSVVINPIEAKITEPVGFSFKIEDTSLPAGQSGLESDMIIDSFNGEKITDAGYFVEKMYYCSTPNSQIELGSGDNKYKITTIENPENPGRGLIGISEIKNEIRVKEEYKKFKGVFFWFKDLFKWLFLLNLFVGLINLLPLGIVDGGRMLQVFLHSVIKNKNKANKIWGFISFFFLALLIIGIVGNYMKKFGLF